MTDRSRYTVPSSNRASINFADLPQEVLLQIGHFCDYHSLQALACTCIKLKILYSVELATRAAEEIARQNPRSITSKLFLGLDSPTSSSRQLPPSRPRANVPTSPPSERRAKKFVASLRPNGLKHTASQSAIPYSQNSWSYTPKSTSNPIPVPSSNPPDNSDGTPSYSPDDTGSKAFLAQRRAVVQQTTSGDGSSDDTEEIIVIGGGLGDRRPQQTEPTVPLKDIQFATLLELPQCQSLKNAIERFLKSFEKSTKGEVELEVRTVRGLLNDLEHAMKERSCWNTLSLGNYQFALQDMHRFIYARLSPVIYAKREYMRQDDIVYRHHDKLLQVVTPEFLDLKPSLTTGKEFREGVQMLEKIDMYVTPEEKLYCIKDACNALSRALPAESGADDFLPLLIYAMLKAHLRSLQTNMEFISRYVDPEEKYGEAYCFFTHFVSACTFLAQTKPEQVQETVRKQLSAHRKSAVNRMLADLENLDEPLISTVPGQSSSTATVSSPSSSYSQPGAKASLMAPALPDAGTIQPRSRAVAAAAQKPPLRIVSQVATRPWKKLPTPAPKPAQSSDAEFLQQLQFVGESDVALEQLFGERMRAFITEYRRVVDIARRNTPGAIPTTSAVPPAASPPAAVITPPLSAGNNEIKCCKHQLPEGTSITCMVADEDSLWLGQRNGCLLIWSVAEQRILGMQAPNRNAIMCAIPVGKMIWCAMDNGMAYAVIKDINVLMKASIMQHDSNHPFVRCMAYDQARDGIWSAATSLPTAGSLETQITYLSTSATSFQRSIIVRDKTPIDIAILCGLVWVSFNSGEVIGYNTRTGALATTLTPFGSGAAGRIRLAAPNTEQLWMSCGTELRILTAAKFAANPSSPELISRQATSAYKDAGPTSFLLATRIPAQSGGTCEAVTTVDERGSATLWNSKEMTCEASFPGDIDPVNGVSLLAAAGSPIATNPTRPTNCFWAAAVGNMLYTWSFS